MGYTVTMRKNETGEVRAIDQDLEWHDSSLYWWTDGNFGCDCNRHIHWLYAEGKRPEDIDDIDCGDTRYTVLYADFPDGSRIAIDSPPAPTSEAA
jgi:hypothetical protein